MSMIVDISTGDRFERLVVLRRAENIGANTAWLCRCDCGNETVVRGVHLIRHAVKSCGCLRKENGRGRSTKIFRSDHPLYKKWIGMKTRCYNPRATSYEDYGGRGIKVCDEWLRSSDDFILWGLRNGWKEGLQIDRIDNDKNYSPDNCRFVTLQENLKNKREKHSYKGQVRPVRW